MVYDHLIDLMQQRQSIRTFSDRPVARDLIEKLIAAALQAPSSCNHQLNRYVVVTDPALRRALCEQAGASTTIGRAPLSIVLLFRMGWNHNKLSVAQSPGMSAQNILLAATALGLRAVVQAGIGKTDVIRALLGIGEGYFVGSIVSIGYGDDRFPRHGWQKRICRTVCLALDPK